MFLEHLDKEHRLLLFVYQSKQCYRDSGWGRLTCQLGVDTGDDTLRFDVIVLQFCPFKDVSWFWHVLLHIL